MTPTQVALSIFALAACSFVVVFGLAWLLDAKPDDGDPPARGRNFKT